MDAGKWDDFFKWFTLKPARGVYFLGPYARYVTVYSQQVRALNLIAALWETEVIKPDTEVAVVGGGAAGLTASAAAALLGAKVTLLEKLRGLMDLQRNNRQRWIHPHIYDWPDPNLDGDTSGLPILDWKADYAERVAWQIEAQWKDIQNRTGRITAHYPLRSVGLDASKERPWLSWNSDASRENREFPVVILAVGFGLEPDSDHQWSYWEEDDIDASFRTGRDEKSWLIAGYGDSALTDLMRLCLHRFRHAELPELFRGQKALKGVQDDLREIRRGQPDTEPDRYITERYKVLETGGLEELLRPRLRTQITKPCLTGATPYIYSADASILNRFILRLLSKLNAFEYKPGPVKGKPIRLKRGFRVRLATGTETFDRVVLRYGPEPAMRTSFETIWKQCAALRKEWRQLPRAHDKTRSLRWDTLYDPFKPREATPAPVPRLEAAPPSVPETFPEAIDRLGIYAKSLTVAKEVLSDGRASVQYRIENLTVLRGELTGVRLWLKSTVGRVGEPKLDAEAKRMDFRWDPDPQESVPSDAPVAQRLETAARNARILSGVLRFGAPLTPDSPPVTFELTIFELNADALSKWEFAQFYAPDQRFHLDRSPIQDLEFFARMVWLPVESLQVRLTLPSGYPSQPFVSWFTCPEPFIPLEAVRENSVLRLGPERDSRFDPGVKPWTRVDADALTSSLSASDVTNTWDLVVRRPQVGSCYSLDWRMPEEAADPASLRLAGSAAVLRRKLLDYREQRRKGRGEHVHRLFLQFCEEVQKLYRDERPAERFEITFFTYNESKRLLELADGWVNGADPNDGLWDFRLPFGLGLAGASFKAVRAFVYVPLEDENIPPDEAAEARVDYFLKVRGSQIAVLLALPLDHPSFHESMQLERSRQCIGILDIGSNLSDAKLVETIKRDGLGPLPGLCSRFREDLYRALMLS